MPHGRTHPSRRLAPERSTETQDAGHGVKTTSRLLWTRKARGGAAAGRGPSWEEAGQAAGQAGGPGGAQAGQSGLQRASAPAKAPRIATPLPRGEPAFACRCPALGRCGQGGVPGFRASGQFSSHRRTGRSTVGRRAVRTPGAEPVPPGTAHPSAATDQSPPTRASPAGWTPLTSASDSLKV